MGLFNPKKDKEKEPKEKKERKPFKETKVGEFLANKAPDILDKVGDFLPDKGGLGILKNIIDGDPKMSVEDKAMAMKLIHEQEIEALRLEVEDRINARDMNKTALQSDDVFVRRFVYFLAAFILLSATSFGVMLFFIHVPEENKRLVEMFADIYLFGGALMVLQFFFGSSYGSKVKDKFVGNKE